MNYNQYVTYDIKHQSTNQLALLLPVVVRSVNVSGDNLIFRVTRKFLRSASVVLRNLTAYQGAVLVDIIIIDRPGAAGRFVVKYSFLSTALNQRFVLELFTDEIYPIPSLASSIFRDQRIFSSAGWLEREAYDLFGVYFSQHSDLRRILTDYGFTGHPFRKDFPLTGFHEVVYNDAEGRVTSEPVELAQELRIFHL